MKHKKKKGSKSPRGRPREIEKDPNALYGKWAEPVPEWQVDLLAIAVTVMLFGVSFSKAPGHIILPNLSFIPRNAGALLSNGSDNLTNGMVTFREEASSDIEPKDNEDLSEAGGLPIHKYCEPGGDEGQIVSYQDLVDEVANEANEINPHCFTADGRGIVQGTDESDVLVAYEIQRGNDGVSFIQLPSNPQP